MWSFWQTDTFTNIMRYIEEGDGVWFVLEDADLIGVFDTKEEAEEHL